MSLYTCLVKISLPFDDLVNVIVIISFYLCTAHISYAVSLHRRLALAAALSALVVRDSPWLRIDETPCLTLQQTATLDTRTYSVGKIRPVKDCRYLYSDCGKESGAVDQCVPIC